MSAENIVVVEVPDKETQQLPHGRGFPRTEEKFIICFSLLTPAV